MCGKPVRNFKLTKDEISDLLPQRNGPLPKAKRKTMLLGESCDKGPRPRPSVSREPDDAYDCQVRDGIRQTEI